MACLLEEMNREKARVGVRTIEEGRKEGKGLCGYDCS